LDKLSDNKEHLWYAEKIAENGLHRPPPRDVADPWYTDNFEATWQDVLAGCQGLLHEVADHFHTRE